jgi:DNA invertase Pin-like site-specific DNA recombinase
MRAVIYSRVSRDDSGEARSNQRQEDDCRKLAEIRNWTVIETCRDVSISAYQSGRKHPGWERVLDLMDSGGVDVVIAWKLDRITRTVNELTKIVARCRSTDVAIVTTEGDLDLSNETGKMVATILGAVAEQEVERKAARQRLSNAQRRSEGKPWRSGWVSFGYDRDKNVVPEQAAMIRQAAESVLNGGSLKGVARTWRESGVTTPRSTKGADGWTHNGVKSILLNPVNAGFLTYRGEEIGRGSWEPILEETAFRQLQALLGNPERRTYEGNGRRAENLLSGIATCAVCDRPVVGGVSNSRKVYKCTNPQGEHLTTDRAEADAFVLNALTLKQEWAMYSVLPDAAPVAGQDQLMESVTALDRREAAITEQFSRGRIEHETWTVAISAIASQRKEMRERLSRIEGEERTASALAMARVSNFMSLSLADKRMTLRSIVKVQLHPRNRRRNVPIGEQVTVWNGTNSIISSPIIAGDNPDSRALEAQIIESRVAKQIASVPPGYSDDE